MIEVKNSQGFPYRFPILYETGGNIQNEANWHKYSDDSCCITVEPDELLICRNGISVLEFVRKHAIAYLANHIYRITEGKYMNGEYDHGLAGTWQFYTKLFKTSDLGKWIEYYDHVFTKKSIYIGRNSLCFCESGQKFKHCHEKVFQDLRWLGKNRIREQLLQFIKLVQAK
jgi:hypothetical protein